MATYIKTLKEDNGDITYPQTTTDAVLTTSGTTLETELGKCVKAEEIGSTADITPTITTAMIKDSAVTSDKIDWTTLGVRGGELTEDVNISGSATVLSCTLDAGKWLIFAGARFFCSRDTGLLIWLRLAVGSDSSAAATAINAPVLDGVIRPQINFVHLETLTSSTTIGLAVEPGVNGTVSKNKTYLYALRVG